MKISLGADHAGYDLKLFLHRSLERESHTILNCGVDAPKTADYPEYTRKVAEMVLSGEAQRGIMVCGSGVGACVAANKIAGIRAGLCHDTFSAHQGVEDDDINLLCLGGRVIGPELALEIARAFLGAKFSNLDRHVRRRDQVTDLEKHSREDHP